MTGFVPFLVLLAMGVGWGEIEGPFERAARLVALATGGMDLAEEFETLTNGP